jgi:putrescine aminotransferase
MGSLSGSGRVRYQKPFGPLLPGCKHVPFGDVDALEHALHTRKFGAFFVEPIQGEAGIIVPPDGYLKAAEQLCRETGTLFVVDEIQTGMGRTGTLFTKRPQERALSDRPGRHAQPPRANLAPDGRPVRY